MNTTTMLLMCYLRIIFAVSTLVIWFGCSDGLDQYDGDIEDVSVIAKQSYGAVMTFHLGQEAGILPEGKLVGVKVRLKKFPDKEFVVAPNLAEQAGLISQHNFPQGNFGVVVEASRVRLRCAKGSTNVSRISVLAKRASAGQK